MSPNYSTSTITQTPVIDIPKLRTILKDVYDIVDCEIFSLTGYDDLNFRIEQVKFASRVHPDLAKRKEDIFIVKFTNPVENANPYLLDAQTQLSKRLREAGIPTAEALPTVGGNLWQHVYMNDQGKIKVSVKLPVRLFTFLPGLMLEKIGYSNSVYFLLGTLLAEYHNATQSFEHKAYEDHYIFMSMENWDQLEIECEIQCQQGLITGEKRIQLIQRGLRDLRKDILVQKDKFKQGLIHSDFNETNILLQKYPEGKYKITGLLDLGDIHKSLLIYDIAALVLYTTVDAKVDDWRSVAKSVIEGYSTKREPADLDYILVSMRARLTCSLLYSLRTVRINYRNEDPSYILKMQENGWNVLERLTQDYDNDTARNE